MMVARHEMTNREWTRIGANKGRKQENQTADERRLTEIDSAPIASYTRIPRNRFLDADHGDYANQTDETRLLV
jgi:hypothetical protein